MRAIHSVLAFVVATTLVLPAGEAEAQTRSGDGITWGAVPAEGIDVSWGRAITVVDGSLDRVLAVVHAYENYHDLMPAFRTARILSRRGDDALVYMEVGVARDTVTLWGQMRILSRQNDDRSRVVEATMMRGNMNQFRARWVLTPIDGGARTRVEFRILVDPDMPLPSSIFTQENVKVARRMLRAVRDRFAG
jgi:ribosome-associated toxin RatA of RatAB toxin-antitoxin module